MVYLDLRYKKIKEDLLDKRKLDRVIFSCSNDLELFKFAISVGGNIDTTDDNTSRRLVSFINDPSVLRYVIDDLNYDITQFMDGFGRNYLYYCRDERCFDIIFKRKYKFDLEHQDYFGQKAEEYNPYLYDYNEESLYLAV